jgi:GNAT superfamily N-acetyltransferase
MNPNAPSNPGASPRQPVMRPIRADETATMLNIINDAAKAYRGAIPDDCWHEPYMSPEALAAEIRHGVAFTGLELDGALAGIIGLQTVRNADLIRHFYVLEEHQGRGLGRALIEPVLAAERPRHLLVGTWAAATWAIRFYERHGFRLVPESVRGLLLRSYWSVPERQASLSVVLAAPALTADEAVRLAGSAERRASP